MTINPLNELKTKGFLILDSNFFDFNKELLDKIKKLFSHMRENEEHLFNHVRLHNIGTEQIKNNSELDDIVVSEKNNENWFQIWKFSEYYDTELFNRYVGHIVQMIYGIDSIQTHSQFTNFRKGCGIKSHADSNSNHNPNRICAVLSYFSENWKEEYGGCLVIENKKIVLPNEDTIVILDFTENNVIHEVTEVLVDKNRFSLTSFVDKQ